MTTKAPKISTLAELQIEKQRLERQSAHMEKRIHEDVEFVKQEYLGTELLNKASETIVPAVVRHADWLNDPINLIAEKLFHARRDVVDADSDRGQGNKLRNIALAVIEGLGAFLLLKFAHRKLISEQRRK